MMRSLYIATLFCLCATSAMAQPIASIESKEEILVVDTLPTHHPDVKVVLYNDNTWRYIRDKAYAQNERTYTDNWNTGSLFAYDTHYSELPAIIDIELVDRFENFHYPYKARVHSKYGVRGRRQHQGVDLSLKTGDPVYAPINGRVRISEWNRGGYGNLIIIRHDNELETSYGHLSERLVAEGDWVEAGQIIGFGGSTGRSSGPHLHFETRYHGHCFDPEWIFDFENGTLYRSTFVLRREYLDIHVNANSYVPEIEFNDPLGDETGGGVAAATGSDGTSVPEGVSSEEGRASGAGGAGSAAAPSEPEPVYHKVVNGDTLSAIARKYSTSVAALTRVNKIENPDRLRLGQKIRVK